MNLFFLEFELNRVSKMTSIGIYHNEVLTRITSVSLMLLIHPPLLRYWKATYIGEVLETGDKKNGRVRIKL